MSTFSSIVNKSGKKLAPRATVRRNASSRASSITPSFSNPSPTTISSLPSVQDTVNGPEVSQRHGAEEGLVLAALPALASQSADVTEPLDTVPLGTDPVLNTSRLAEHLILNR